MNRLTLFVLLLISNGLIAAEKDEQAEEKSKAQKTLWTATIERGETKQIDSLVLTSKQIPVFLVPRNNELRPTIEIRLQFTKDTEGWKLIQPGDRPLKKGKLPSEYSTFLYLNSKVSELTLTAVGPKGEKQTESLLILSPEAQELEIVSPLRSFYASLGLSRLVFEQTRFGVFTANAGVVELGYSTLESESRWGLLAHGKMTVATYDSQPIEANPQVIDGRLVVGYRVGIGDKGRWRYRLFGGMSYLTMLSNGSPFGFTNLMAPDLSVRATFFKSSKTSYALEGRLVPLKNASFSDQRGYHVSATWTRILKSLRRQDVKLEYSQTDFNNSNQHLGVVLFTLSLGYTL